MVASNSAYKESIITLFHLISMVDGKLSEKEEKLRSLIMMHENITDKEFQESVHKLSSYSNQEIYELGVNKLKKCDPESQIRALAWLRNLANAGGFMGQGEWKIIYQIYKNELNLNLKDIISHELPQISLL
ncbi:hypothetical protein QQ008_26455 [Fulvivirgaceae bacterium BMA10]|uniref:Co-chaperone DjlA N-terminal domain-containing protein n=1 Tax=Splendidivirga corallicola TaxID=3051826 RepID=A0ABT8KZZ0_9BACT|nr:hypothetical protein [Fulvivirgaceae bacterium BMA10]